MMPYRVDNTGWLVQKSAQADDGVKVANADIPEATCAHWLLAVVAWRVNGQFHLVASALVAVNVATETAVMLHKQQS